MMTENSQGKYLVGITGGIGSGKSTVCRFLASYMQLPLVDIDGICRNLLGSGQPGWEALRQHISPAFFAADGALDRRKLRREIFSDSRLRETVDALLHPLALDRMKQEVTGKADEHSAVLVDVPLLYEAGWESFFDSSLVVYADRPTCCRRIMNRDKLEADQVALSIEAQIRLTEKAMLADHVVDNSGCWLFSRLQAVHLAGVLQNDFCGK